MENDRLKFKKEFTEMARIFASSIITLWEKAEFYAVNCHYSF